MYIKKRVTKISNKKNVVRFITEAGLRIKTYRLDWLRLKGLMEFFFF